MNSHEGAWSIVFLLLALLISIFASYTMFNFIGNLKRQNNEFRFFWLAGGSFVFGIGLWAKHFVASMALENVLFFTWSMPFALLLSIFFSLMAFVVLTSQASAKYRMAIGTSVLTFSVGFLNYFSILGQPIARITVQPVLIACSLLILLMGTYTSLKLHFMVKEKNRVLASVTLGLSALLVQALSTEAIRLEYRTHYNWDKLNEDIHFLVLIVGLGGLIILASTWATWYIDKRMTQMDERYRLLIENSLDTIAIFKKEKWVFVNQAGLRMFDAEQPSDLLGKPISSFLRTEDIERVRERLQNLQYKGSNKPVEQIWYSLSGRMLDTEIVETLTTLNNEPAVQVIIRDISERKKNEELLINSEKLYVAGQLAAGIAHEIRNPLTSLKGFLHLIGSGRKEASYYDIMNSELDRIEGIVSELLMLAKPQVYDLSYHDVRVMMRDTVTLLETQAILHNVYIEAEYGKEPMWVFGVENQIKQVFINIIKNAIEAMSDGGAIHVRLSREEDSVRVLISDEGPGIREEQLAKMGQPFYTTKEKGTGLGLMVSYKIVDNHDGQIRVSSRLGIGTSFEIRFPFRYPETPAVMNGN
ncbi:ATP-binding protein [Cohnella thailandensis]|uniref:histidine kinase n=1 Tax=Cohnella thailandensis TaxID=557557 RepID=A0A841T5I8_9BACL|nr:ATP-binding protein [Cohnella thailandensis]MBB6637350.1 PAS domain S-box protein [Cohnella thailandensis]MBP1976679.1 PAS domain S-box-containing protein [Cohnella thailandensis]